MWYHICTHIGKPKKVPASKPLTTLQFLPTVYGTWSLTLNLGLRHTFRWVFTITDVSKAILGADFLKHYDLYVDMKSHCLLDPLTHLKVQSIVSSVTSSLVLSLLRWQPKLDYQKTLMDFPTITSTYNGNVQIKHEETHHIGIRGTPVHTKPWRLASERLKITKEEFQHMLELGIIRLSLSNWASISPSYGAQKDYRGLASLWGQQHIK